MRRQDAEFVRDLDPFNLQNTHKCRNHEWTLETGPERASPLRTTSAGKEKRRDKGKEKRERSITEDRISTNMAFVSSREMLG